RRVVRRPNPQTNQEYQGQNAVFERLLRPEWFFLGSKQFGRLPPAGGIAVLRQEPAYPPAQVGANRLAARPIELGQALHLAAPRPYVVRRYSAMFFMN